MKVTSFNGVSTVSSSFSSLINSKDAVKLVPSKLPRSLWYVKTEHSKYYILDKYRINDAFKSRAIQKDDENNYTEQVSNQESYYGMLPLKLIFGFSTIGLLETIYLSYVKLSGKEPICLTDGCESVINSIYSQIAGIPLSILGMVGYGAVAVIAGNIIFSNNNRDYNNTYKRLLLYGGTLMASCSAYLMYILFSELNGNCPWCFASALLSFSILLCSLLNQSPQSLKKEAVPCVGLSATSILTLMLLFNNADFSSADDFHLPYKKPEIVSESTEQSRNLALRLNQAGVKMFGAFWCSHCYNQKEAFGTAAMSDFPYIECFPEGYGKGIKIAKVCSENEIKGLPTWMFGNKKYPGEQSLETLEQALEEYEKSKF